MILTVTLNPALDITYDVPALHVGRSVRVGAVRSRAGGKGVNVASVVRALGGEAMVVAPGALTAPDPFRDGLDRLGLPYRLVPAFARVRHTVAVVGAEGATTMLLEPGENAIGGTEEALVSAVAEELAGASCLVVSGSLPPGLPETLPARLAALAASHGVPSIVDVSGPALHAAPASGAVLMPNIDEMSEIVGRRVNSIEDVVRHGRGLLKAGAAAVVVTLGERGAVAVTPAGAWRAHPVMVVDGNPTGAGDAAAAALAMHLASGAAKARAGSATAATEAGSPTMAARAATGAEAASGPALEEPGAAGTAPATRNGVPDTVRAGHLRRSASAIDAVDWPAALADAVATSAACVLKPVAGEIDPQARARWRDTIIVEELT